MTTLSIMSVCEPNLIAINSILEWYRLNTTQGRRSYARRARRLLKQTIQSGMDKSRCWSLAAAIDIGSRASVSEADVPRDTAVIKAGPVAPAWIPASEQVLSNFDEDVQVIPSPASESERVCKSGWNCLPSMRLCSPRPTSAMTRNISVRSFSTER